HHTAGCLMVSGPSVTVFVVFGGTVTLPIAPNPRRWSGEVITALTSPVWVRPVLLVMSVSTVSLDRLKSAALAWSTCALLSDSAPSTASWTGNWMPVLLSGGIWFQSTSSSVNIVCGLFGLTSIATVLRPEWSSPAMGKANLAYAPVTVVGVATWKPLTHTAAAPITPLTISVACWPERRCRLKLVRHHQGTRNSGTVSAPTWFSYP